MSLIPHYKILVDDDRWQWLSDPVYVGKVDETDWNSMVNDDNHQYKFHDLEVRDKYGQITCQFCALELLTKAVW
jgi:hypothetical protein